MVLRPPNIVFSQAEWDAKQWYGHPMWGGQQVQHGPERQMEWNIKMVLMHLPFLILALCGYFR